MLTKTKIARMRLLSTILFFLFTMALFSKASQILHGALDRRVYLKDVTLVIPSSWRDVKCKIQIHPPRGTSTFGAADIIIDTDHPFHKESPFTQQSRGCGQPGDFMSIPSSFLTSLNETERAFGNPAKVLAYEWAKYRYGVFDEYGFAGDPVYPNFFKISEDIVHTGSSNVPIVGSWVRIDQPDEKCEPAEQHLDGGHPCFFKANLDYANENATCSLGYMSFLDNAKEICSTDDIWHHKLAMAPTKHNVLCQGKSVYEIIFGHEDLSSRTATLVKRSEESEFEDLDPETKTEGPQVLESIAESDFPAVNIKVVRQPAPKYVLILESSSSMMEQNLWQWVHKAAQKFIRYDLADNSRLAIVSFSNDSVVQHSLAVLSDERSRARLADTIPDKYKVQRNPNQRCVICGVQTAMQKVLPGEEAGAHLILITRGDNNTLSLTDENIILEHAKYFQIKFSAILLPQGEQSALSFYDSVSQLTGGRTAIFSTPSEGDTSLPVGTNLYSKMIDAFYDIRRLDSTYPADIPITVHTQTTTRSDGALGSTGSFVIDTTLGRETQFSVVVENADDYYIKSVSFTDSAGQSYGPYSSLTNDFNVINMKMINFPQDTLSPPFDDPAHLGMKWDYVVQWYNGGNMELQNAIRVESKPRNLGSFGLIDIQMWTNSDGSSDIVSNLRPLAMYVSCYRGRSPILSAKVQVSVTVTLSNGTIIPIDAIQLFDEGSGDPDLTANDGIYSRYLIQYPAVGRYSFSVEVDNNDGAAYTVQEGRGGRGILAKPPTTGSSMCCGSKVNVPQDLRFSTGHFKRQVNSNPVVHLLGVPINNPFDIMAPSRIGDLKVHIDPKEQKINAEWTAPGDDFDHGSVAGYNFIVSDEVLSLIDPHIQPAILHTIKRSDEAGTAVSYSFSFQNFDRDYHIGIYGFDETGNKANISNIVGFRIPQPETTVAPSGSTKEPSGPDDSQIILIGAIVGGVLGLILVIVLVITLYCIAARRRRFFRHHPNAKSSGVNVDLHHNRGLGSGPGSDNTTDNGSYDEAKNSSSNHLVPKISTISNAYRAAQTSNGGSFANGITPTYWSASQLLKEHEERKLREAMANNISGINNNDSFGEEANAAYDYRNENFHQFGYYNGSQLVESFHAQMDPYFGYNPHRLSTTDSTGYPVTYGYQIHPAGNDMYNPHAVMLDQFNATLEGSSDAESTLMRNGPPIPHRSSQISAGALLPKLSGSDQSSSGTLGVANQSLQGSLLSVNSARPPSTTSKTRNITQV